MEKKLKKFGFISWWISLGTDLIASHDCRTQIRLANFLATILSCSFFVYALIYLFFDLPIMSYVTLAVGFIFMTIPVVNRLGHTYASRVFMMAMGNIVVFFYSIISPAEIHAHEFFLLTISFPFLLFRLEEKKTIIACLIFSIICISLNELHHVYNHFVILLVPDELIQSYGIVNLFTLLLLQVALVYYFFMTTGKSRDELNKSHDDLKDTTAQLVHAEKMSALGEISAGVAHELNQPLNIIKIISQSLLRDIAKGRFKVEDVSGEMPEILNQVDRMAGIIDHMRLYSRKTGGTPNERLDFNEVINGAFTFIEQQLRNHNIEVVKDLSPNLPAVECDRVRMEQVIMNLVNNARHALESTGRDNLRIEVRSFPSYDGNDAIVEVVDNGPGVPDVLKNTIFKPFFTTRETGKGTGLGLAIVSKILEEHGATIVCDNTPSGGATFRMRIPSADMKTNGGAV